MADEGLALSSAERSSALTEPEDRTLRQFERAERSENGGVDENWEFRETTKIAQCLAGSAMRIAPVGEDV